MEKIKDNGMQCAILDNLHTIMCMPIEPCENIEAFMTHGKKWSLKTSPNIYLMIHGFNTFGPIISNLVHELTLNPLLLFHHVMDIPKY
jgi:hypothetical protein